MPEHNPFRPIVPATPDLRPDTPTGEPRGSSWAANPMLPAQYDGPTPDREYDAGASAGHVATRRASPVPAVPPPTERPGQAPIDPPPSTDL